MSIANTTEEPDADTQLNTLSLDTAEEPDISHEPTEEFNNPR